ncbi:MAG TPA: penicillin-binding protein 2 [Candidatus Moranbacteria bacterium]|nr:penicillin-binding protein 2 [Candidatus Moranbacteria bacterium]
MLSFKRNFRKKGTAKGAEIEDSIMTITEKEEAIIETPYKKKGLKIIWIFILCSLFLILTRVFYLDVIRGEYYSEVSRENRIRSIPINAPRGNILDKYGNFLAHNIPSIDAVLVPYYLPKDDSGKEKISKIAAEILDMDPGNAEAIIASQDEESLDAILLKENISQEQSLLFLEREKELPGIMLYKTAIRKYENSLIFSHVIGYDGKITREEIEKNKEYLMTDYIGKSGIEKSYESELKGRYGAYQVEIDSMGKVKKNLGTVNPISGNDLILNIDEGLQKKIYDNLSSVLEESGTKTAAAVAINPQTGGVLAMVSLPSYDNNLFARGITDNEYKEIIQNRDLPLFNRVVSGEYPPGSTLKPAIAAAALSEGTITPSTIINGLGGRLVIGNFSFGDWKAHGPSDVRQAIAESNDVFFYTIGGGYGGIEGLGMNRMKKYENLFGFGSPLGIDLPGESSGLIPDEQWKLDKIKEKWYIGDSYHSAIGQGFITTTPLQLANFTASIANGGTLYSPRIVNRVRNIDGEEKIISAEIIRSGFISKSAMDVVREGMRQTVESGTAQTLKNLPVAVAGKTGTAQFGTEDKTHAWFTSFAPYDNPEIAMVVLVEGGGEGHSSAVPVTKEVYEWYFSQSQK